MKQLLKLIFGISILFTSIQGSYSQNIYTLAGSGTLGFSGDGGNAVNAKFDGAFAIATASGNIYVADYNNNRIRKIDAAGIITTIAGTGTAGYSGDGAAATLAELNGPNGLAIDVSGNIYIGDRLNSRIRKINTSGIISTFAGNGNAAFSGDGGQAINAELNLPTRLAIDAAGNLFIADQFNHRIRKINTTGIITTIAGIGTQGYSGDGGAAISSQLNTPCAVAVDASGNVYIADVANHRIRKVNTSGIISTFAGNGNPGYSGDGNAAISAQLNSPSGIVADTSGNIYLADNANHCIRKISNSGIISSIAGTGIGGYSGDGGPASSALLNWPGSITVDASNNLYLTTCGSSGVINSLIREICVSSCVTNIKSQLKNNNLVSLFPNPTSGAFKIKIDTYVENCELIITNTLGQKVHKQTLSAGLNDIITDNLSKGFYTYNLLDFGQNIFTGKLTVE